VRVLRRQNNRKAHAGANNTALRAAYGHPDGLSCKWAIWPTRTLNLHNPSIGETSVSASAIAFFIVKEPAKPKPKPKPKAKPRLTKHDQAACRAYFKASTLERKVILHSQVDTEHQDKLAARRAWRQSYQRQYRALRAMATIIL